MPNVIGTYKTHTCWRVRLLWANHIPGVYVRSRNGNIWLVPGTHNEE